MADGNRSVSNSSIYSMLLADPKNPDSDSHPVNVGRRTVSKPEATELSIMRRAVKWLAERTGINPDAHTHDVRKAIKFTGRAYGNNGYAGANVVNVVNLHTTKGDILLAVGNSGGILVDPTPDGNPIHRTTYDHNTTSDFKARLPTANIEEVYISTDSGDLTGVIQAAGDYVCSGSIYVEIISLLPVFAKTNNGTLIPTGYDCHKPSETCIDTKDSEYIQYTPSLSGSNHCFNDRGRIQLTADGDITFKFLHHTLR